MKSGKGHHEEEEDEEDEVGTKQEATPSNNNTKDGKNNDKANAIRSKHSVTEQRRRSKINERFQILRDLIPNTDQKRDTASFLLEVIQYVQFLQEKVQKHEGSYQPWSSEPTKLMPWRNSHWRMQAFPVQPQALTNGTGPGLTYPGTFEENPTIVTSTMQANQQNPTEAHPSRDILFKAMDQPNELANKSIPTIPLHASMPVPVPNDSAFIDPLPRPASDEGPHINDAQNQQEELAIEGGTISVSSSYSKELLNSLTQALQSTGLDLSQATISVQINLGKQANRGMTSGPSIRKDNEDPPASGNQQMERLREASNDEDVDQAQKRLKI